MARDIEEFLRRAAERRKQQSGGSPTPPARSPEQRQQPSRAPRPSQASPTPVALEAPIIIDDVQIVEQRIQSKLKSSIDTSRISAHADALGKRVSSVHDRVERQVHKHLDHNVGKIDDTETVTDDPSPEIVGRQDKSAAKKLRKLLADPKSVGQAIILAEILKRPEF
jgi:3-oxoacyl-ACP reductase-like protein